MKFLNIELLKDITNKLNEDIDKWYEAYLMFQRILPIGGPKESWVSETRGRINLIWIDSDPNLYVTIINSVCDHMWSYTILIMNADSQTLALKIFLTSAILLFDF